MVVTLGLAGSASAVLCSALRARRWEDALHALSVDAAGEADSSGWLALHYAVAYSAPLPLINRLLLAHPDGAKAPVGRGPLARLPLHLAIARGAPYPVVSRLLASYPPALHAHAETTASAAAAAAGAGSVVAAGSGGRPALLAACHTANSGLVRLLLEAEADPSATDRQGVSCLMVAVEQHQREIVFQLLSRGADAAAADARGRRALDRALTADQPDREIARMVQSALEQQHVVTLSASPELLLYDAAPFYPDPEVPGCGVHSGAALTLEAWVAVHLRRAGVLLCVPLDARSAAPPRARRCSHAPPPHAAGPSECGASPTICVGRMVMRGRKRKVEGGAK